MFGEDRNARAKARQHSNSIQPVMFLFLSCGVCLSEGWSRERAWQEVSVDSSSGAWRVERLEPTDSNSNSGVESEPTEEESTLPEFTCAAHDTTGAFVCLCVVPNNLRRTHSMNRPTRRDRYGCRRHRGEGAGGGGHRGGVWRGGECERERELTVWIWVFTAPCVVFRVALWN